MTVAYTVWLTKEPAKPHRISAQDRILDVPALNEAMERVAVGETVVEPALVEDLVSAPECEDPLAVLTAREREVLALMAEGRTDRGIREALWVRQKTVESHVRSIFRKLWSCYVATYCARSHRASLRDTTPNCPVPSEPIPNRCLLGPPPVSWTRGC